MNDWIKKIISCIEKHALLFGFMVLILPLIVVGVVRSVLKINILDNPEFWYGYMGYFGTVALATVSWVQSIKTEETSNRFMTQQLRQKLGYFELVREEVSTEQQGSKTVTRLNSYSDLMAGGFVDEVGEDERSKQYVLSLRLKNVGEDIICNMEIISEKINGEELEGSCSNKVTYKGEIITFGIDIKKYYQSKIMDIDLDIEMENVAGIRYTQKFNIEVKKLVEYQVENNTYSKYRVTLFDTSISFIE